MTLLIIPQVSQFGNKVKGKVKADPVLD